MRTKLSVSKTLLTIMLALSVAVFSLTGCSDDDDENKINVYNKDDEEYRVKLHDNITGQVVEDFRLGEIYDLADNRNEFKDVENGDYYITIHEIHNDNTETQSDSSTTFYMDSKTTRNFYIKTPGILKTSDDGIIEVCNRDDEKYEVKLHSIREDIVVDTLWVDEIYDVRDKCNIFEGIDSGKYYITIHEDGSEYESDSSEIFQYDGDADWHLYIETPGVIEMD